jgi:hypothetical protein
MDYNIVEALQAVVREKNVDQSTLMDSLIVGLQSAAKKKVGRKKSKAKKPVAKKAKTKKRAAKKAPRKTAPSKKTARSA